MVIDNIIAGVIHHTMFCTMTEINVQKTHLISIIFSNVYGKCSILLNMHFLKRFKNDVINEVPVVLKNLVHFLSIIAHK